MAKLITIEGVEGVGKSSVISTICHELKRAHIPHVLTREPGGTPLAEDIRELLITKRDEYVMPLTETLLFFASRCQHITQMIRPALSRGEWVVSDRFTDSSLAYQGAGRGVTFDKLYALQNWVQEDLVPDCTILLDAPVEVGLARIQSRDKDRIEEETIDFFNRVRHFYLQCATDNPKRYRVVKADQVVEKVQQDVIVVMQEVIHT